MKVKNGERGEQRRGVMRGRRKDERRQGYYGETMRTRGKGERKKQRSGASDPVVGASHNIEYPCSLSPNWLLNYPLASEAPPPFVCHSGLVHFILIRLIIPLRGITSLYPSLSSCLSLCPSLSLPSLSYSLSLAPFFRRAISFQCENSMRISVGFGWDEGESKMNGKL